MQKSKKEITELYEECLNAEVARMIAIDNLGDNAFDVLHFVELYLRDQFISCSIGHTANDLKAKGCHLYYSSSDNRNGYLSISIRPTSGIMDINLTTQEEEIEFSQLADLLDWWTGKKTLKGLHPDSYQYRERSWLEIYRENEASEADEEIKRLKEERVA